MPMLKTTGGGLNAYRYRLTAKEGGYGFDFPQVLSGWLNDDSEEHTPFEACCREPSKTWIWSLLRWSKPQPRYPFWFRDWRRSVSMCRLASERMQSGTTKLWWNS